MKVIIGLIIIYTLFSFKFNLINYADSGIRVDDIFLAIFAVLIVYKTKIVINKPIILMVLFVLWSLFSTMINSLITGISILQGILFSIRNIEYLIFFYIGYFYRFYFLSLNKLFVTYLFYSIFIVLLIYYGIISGTSQFNASRAFSNTNGPYEYVMIMAFLGLYFFHHGNRLLGVISGIMMFLTYSRITIVSFLLVYLSGLNKKTLLVMTLTTVLGIGLTILLISNLTDLKLMDLYLLDRIAGFFSAETFHSAEALIQNVVVVSTHQEYLDNVYNDIANYNVQILGGDASALIRLNRWLVLVYSTLVLNPISPFVGLGPSFASVGVDGNYIRIFAETGLIGIVIYVLFLWSLISFARKNKEKTLEHYVYVLALSAVFIDVLVSYKAMLLLWFYFGYLYKKSLESDK